jgi:hypothetical protein
MAFSEMIVPERLHAVLNFQPCDRMPMIEWASWWDKTLERWHAEGLPVLAPKPAQERYALYRHFGLDVYYQAWHRAIHWRAPKPAAHGAGIIKNEDDYARIREHMFVIEDGWPINKEELAQWAQEQRAGRAAIWFTWDGFFWLPRTLIGIEEHLYSFYDQPGLLHSINRENAAWMLRMIDEICAVATPDFMTFAEDLSYNNGPMLSKAHFEEFMLPYYQMVIPVLKDRGIRVFIDSDGNIHEPAAWFAAAGIEGILPLERQAGVDLAALRRVHPRQLYIGGFDKMCMPQGEAAMRAEFERLLPVARQGGYIISCDHQTPPGVSLEQYHIYLRLLGEYARRATSA